MPNSNTFDCLPIGEFVRSYLRQSKVSVDPFARDNCWATHTNDLNPGTAASHHMDALDFLTAMRIEGIKADLVIFDPPYSPRQIKECYDGIGLKMGGDEAWRTHGWTKEREAIDDILEVGGVVISCGWNSSGMGKRRSYQIIEILMVCHGAGHNDTICVAEKRIAAQGKLFSIG